NKDLSFNGDKDMLNQAYNGLEVCLTNLDKQLVVICLDCHHGNILEHINPEMLLLL
ncbi:MAG: hypothetical protein RLZZ293_16, partial [Pseudomonadota bacterium]